MKIAHNWASNLPICEYGVNIITYNKTWKHIVEDAKNYARKEIEYIKKHEKETLWDIEQLESIADDSYFDCEKRDDYSPQYNEADN